MPEGEAFAYLETIGIPRTVDLLIRIETLARGSGRNAVANGAHEVNIGLLRDVNLVAVEMAGLADGEIVARILSTHNRVRRPATGVMETHIRSEAGPLGLVRVALLDELEKIVNPNGYGPFWRAQEYGTGGDVPSQVGRRIFGTFESSGTPPDAEQRGAGVGRDLAFVPGGSDPGLGVISTELPARHFLRDGSAEAAAQYVKRMEAVQARWAKKIELLILELRTQRRRGRFLGIIEA